MCIYTHNPKSSCKEKSPVSFLTSDIPGNAVEDVSVWHISKARPDVHRACNRAQDGMLDQLCQQQKVILGGDLILRPR